VQHAVWLFRNWKQLPILASGGGTNERPHAAVMQDVLRTEGIPAEMIWTESHSSNTHESALNSSALLRAQGVRRIALVTEAYSMPRAARAFERAGITVVPAVSRRTQLSGGFRDLFPEAAAIDRNGEIIHEFVGLLWYKLRGWI
jgi:uncharacterized SAM-binding protein YcdF (DUF218 family)